MANKYDSWEAEEILTEKFERTVDEMRLMWLDALERAGVDNWDGIDFAHEIHTEFMNDEIEQLERGQAKQKD